MRGIHEARHAGQNLDVIARQLRLRDIDFRLDHMLDAENQVRPS